MKWASVSTLTTPQQPCSPPTGSSWLISWSVVTFYGGATNIVFFFSCSWCCGLDWFWSQSHFFWILVSARTRTHFHSVLFRSGTGRTQDFWSSAVKTQQHCNDAIIMTKNYTLFLKPKMAHSFIPSNFFFIFEVCFIFEVFCENG